MVLRFGRGEVVEHSLDHRRGEFLRGQTVASSDDTHIAASRLMQCVDAIQVKRLARAARLFGAVEDGDRLGARRESFCESLHVKRPVQPHLEHADFLSARRRDNRPSRAPHRSPEPISTITRSASGAPW